MPADFLVTVPASRRRHERMLVACIVTLALVLPLGILTHEARAPVPAIGAPAKHQTIRTAD
jgi:hypothetical protein